MVSSLPTGWESRDVILKKDLFIVSMYVAIISWNNKEDPKMVSFDSFPL